MSGDSPGAPAAHDVRLIAFYLPQFHPEPANDGHHGPGFTEWVLLAGARPLFRGHQQPVIPGELGFYDLRVPEVREAQAALPRRYGISAFCWWRCWSRGRRLLERPFRECSSQESLTSRSVSGGPTTVGRRIGPVPPSRSS